METQEQADQKRQERIKENKARGERIRAAWKRRVEDARLEKFTTQYGVLYKELVDHLTETSEELVFYEDKLWEVNQGTGELQIWREHLAKQYIAGLVLETATAAEIDDIYKKITYMTAADDDKYQDVLNRVNNPLMTN